MEQLNETMQLEQMERESMANFGDDQYSNSPAKQSQSNTMNASPSTSSMMQRQQRTQQPSKAKQDGPNIVIN